MHLSGRSALAEQSMSWSTPEAVPLCRQSLSWSLPLTWSLPLIWRAVIDAAPYSAAVSKRIED
jgi:hypothetical protein